VLAGKVFLEVPLEAEGAGADGALEGPLARVHQAVPIEFGAGVEALVAPRPLAPERLHRLRLQFAVLLPQVARDGGAVWARHLAHVTQEARHLQQTIMQLEQKAEKNEGL
jgi:hypothetical protein